MSSRSAPAMSVLWVGALSVALALSVLLVTAPRASATFPGDNGPLLTPGGMVNENGTDRYTWNTFSFYPAYGSFSPEGDAIAYSTCVDGCDRDALRIRTAAGDDTEVVVLPAGLDVGKISWSPDATRLAVGVQGGSPGFASSILLVGIEDGSSQYLVQGNGSWDPKDPDWQPTGELIAFTRGEDLFTVHAGTGAEVQRTFECTYPSNPDDGADCNFEDGVETQVANPSWYPDGEHLLVDVVENHRTDDTSDIRSYVARMTLGSAATPMVIDLPDTPDSSYGFSSPIVSPDGSKAVLTYAVNLDDQDSWVAPLNGGPAVSMSEDHWISDWQPCPDGTCPSFSTDKTTPTLKVTVLKDFGLNAVASLTPAHAGSPITITLDRKTPKGWRSAGNANPPQNVKGVVMASFDRPRARRCRLTASWAGDADHLAVTARKAFAC